MCSKKDLSLQIGLEQTFSNSIYLEFTRKESNSDAVLISAVFETP